MNLLNTRRAVPRLAALALAICASAAAIAGPADKVYSPVVDNPAFEPTGDLGGRDIRGLLGRFENLAAAFAVCPRSVAVDWQSAARHHTGPATRRDIASAVASRRPRMASHWRVGRTTSD